MGQYGSIKWHNGISHFFGGQNDWLDRVEFQPSSANACDTSNDDWSRSMGIPWNTATDFWAINRIQKKSQKASVQLTCPCIFLYMYLDVVSTKKSWYHPRCFQRGVPLDRWRVFIRDDIPSRKRWWYGGVPHITQYLQLLRCLRWSLLWHDAIRPTSPALRVHLILMGGTVATKRAAAKPEHENDHLPQSQSPNEKGTK